MTRRRRRRRRRASSRFPFEGEGRRRGEDAVAPRDARLRCGSGEEGETTPERRRGWRTRERRLAFPTPEKKPSYCTWRSLFRRFQKPFFMDLASRGARFQSADFPSPKSRTASALRSTGVLQSRTPYNLRSIAPAAKKKRKCRSRQSASGSIARTRVRTPRHRPGNARRTRYTIRTSRTRVSRRTNAHRAKRTSAGDTLARPLDLS
jgi:hypothetical protein